MTLAEGGHAREALLICLRKIGLPAVTQSAKKGGLTVSAAGLGLTVLDFPLSPVLAQP